MADQTNPWGTTEAADSAAGLKLLRSDVHIDLLVTDVGLPGGMNGRQMAEAGMDMRPGLKTLFITGYAENAVMGYGQLGAGMGVLTKPFAVEHQPAAPAPGKHHPHDDGHQQQLSRHAQPAERLLAPDVQQRWPRRRPAIGVALRHRQQHHHRDRQHQNQRGPWDGLHQRAQRRPRIRDYVAAAEYQRVRGRGLRLAKRRRPLKHLHGSPACARAPSGSACASGCSWG